MGLEARAQVTATPQFVEHLQSTLDFFKQQDANTAQARFKRLKSSIQKIIEILAWAPASGRPAQLLCSKNDMNMLALNELMRTAKANELPFLREVIVDNHIILYAHNSIKILLIAIKHQKELGFIRRA